MRISSIAFGIAMLSSISTATCAGVTITGTRIIFPSNQNTVTVQLSNPDDRPALIQAWLDNGDPHQIPEADKIPFILTPPLTQIAANKGQMLRLIAKDTTALPQDRESLYWFNILDIPAAEQVESAEKNKLQVSIRSRIKLFYRPVNLKISQDKAFANITFKYNEINKSITVNNPSPYYINFYNVSLNPDKENIVYADPLMVAPYSTESFKPGIQFKPQHISYLLINDYGGNLAYQTVINGAE
ncbi:MAG: molecular chaperone [Acinetobacter sp.]|jgi:fimbrial chaperone protein/chaperone protein EcpD|uniref:fimbrial biogenesis chaperone n=1 Tax=Acinetobacter sp. TaxID=472 RepID=UPI00281F1EB3|nr:molecular chaperone [Acinetobacter sp.]MDR2061794.1 molecular chaperone [Acinetobacter sp.]